VMSPQRMRLGSHATSHGTSAPIRPGSSRHDSWLDTVMRGVPARRRGVTAAAEAARRSQRQGGRAAGWCVSARGAPSTFWPRSDRLQEIPPVLVVEDLNAVEHSQQRSRHGRACRHRCAPSDEEPGRLVCQEVQGAGARLRQPVLFLVGRAVFIGAAVRDWAVLVEQKGACPHAGRELVPPARVRACGGPGRHPLGFVLGPIPRPTAAAPAAANQGSIANRPTAAVPQDLALRARSLH